MIDTGSKAWLSDFLPRVISIARGAGDAIMGFYAQEAIPTSRKQNGSRLTQADLSSNSIILDGLTRLAPEWPILSEESTEVPFDQRSLWEYYWLIDPLDGTEEFLNGSCEFTVNIALIKNDTPILGVVCAPAMDKLYFAAMGEAAYKIEDNVLSKIEVAKVRPKTFRVVVSRSHAEEADRLTQNIGHCEFVHVGSSLKLCLVAEGSAHIYPRTGPTMEWDTAASHCILEEAGGFIEDLSGRCLKYNKKSLYNPGFFATAAKCCVHPLITGPQIGK